MLEIPVPWGTESVKTEGSAANNELQNCKFYEATVTFTTEINKIMIYNAESYYLVEKFIF